MDNLYSGNLAASSLNNSSNKMIRIKEANLDHVKAIVNQWLDLMKFHKELDPEFFKDTDSRTRDYENSISNTIECQNADSKVFVALDNETVVGYVTMYIEMFAMPNYNDDSYCVIGDMMISEKYRNNGIGGLFIAEAEKLAKKFEAQKLMLYVVAKNQLAFEFYNHNGFEYSFYRMTKVVD